MSRRGDRARRAVGGAVVAALLVGGVLVASRSWDRPVVRTPTPTAVANGACPAGVPAVAVPRVEAFALAGTVVRAEQWCGVPEVVVEVAADVSEGGTLVAVAATTRASGTLGPRDAPTARLAVGPDGWLAIGLVQADARTLANGGAWVTVTAGEPLR